MKLYLVIALTAIAYGFYWLTDRITRQRRARMELAQRKKWWKAVAKAYELSDEAEQTILGIG